MKELDPLQEACKLIAKCSLDSQVVSNSLSALQSSEGRGYTAIRIPKKSGGTRLLHAPCEEIKIIQAALLPFLYDRFPTCDQMFGFQPKRSVVSNARFHLTVFDRNNPKKVFGYRVPRWVLRIDLKDAFSSVTAELLKEMYLGMFNPQRLVGYHGWDKQQAGLVYEQFIDLMLQLTTHNGCLPQGAPTSPYLLNLALCHTGVVKRIVEVCSERETRQPFRFSFYADDITVSSAKDKISNRTIEHLITAIEQDGWFTVNRQKTSLNSAKYKAHIITGVVLTLGRTEISPGRFVVAPKLTLPQKTLRSLRGQIHQVRLALAQPDFPGMGFEGLSETLGNIAWVNDVYHGFPMPLRIRQEIVAFEEAWSKYQGQRRAEYNRHLKELAVFLRTLLVRRGELY